MKDGASEAEQKQLQPSPKRQGLATYVRVLLPSRFHRTVSVVSFGIALCFACRLVNSGLFDDRPFRGCVAAFGIGTKALLRSQEDPIRPAHSAPAPRDTAQPRSDRLSTNAQTTRSTLLPRPLTESGGSGSGSGSGSKEKEKDFKSIITGLLSHLNCPRHSPMSLQGAVCQHAQREREQNSTASTAPAPAPHRSPR
jgi:hypothetical protein